MRILPTFALGLSLVATSALAADDDPAKVASDLVNRFLTAVKAKKWADAKKFIHPKTLEAIAERKKRLGKEDHPMAPWAFEKTESYLKDFKLGETRKGTLGTYVVETAEDNFQVQEKGVAEGEAASYLVGRSGGKWYVIDKKRGEVFTPASVKYGYKGYLDQAPAADEKVHDEED